MLLMVAGRLSVHICPQAFDNSYCIQNEVASKEALGVTMHGKTYGQRGTNALVSWQLVSGV